MKFIAYSLVLSLLLFATTSCQDETQNLQSTQKQTVQQPVQTNKTQPTVTPSVKNSSTPEAIDETEKTIGTETEVLKTNVNWKDFNPIVKGKKYTYTYTMNEIKSEISREITEVTDKSYSMEQKFVSPDGQESILASVKLSVVINPDNSPAIIPITSVGGEKIDTNVQVQVSEKTEKLKVPFGEFDAIKITTVNNNITTTNWYGKNIGLIKAVQTSNGTTFTLELKNYN